jgi:hypothetical protein
MALRRFASTASGVRGVMNVPLPTAGGSGVRVANGFSHAATNGRNVIPTTLQYPANFIITDALKIFWRQYSSWPEFYQGFSCGIIRFARQPLSICIAKPLKRFFLLTFSPTIFILAPVSFNLKVTPPVFLIFAVVFHQALQARDALCNGHISLRRRLSPNMNFLETRLFVPAPNELFPRFYSHSPPSPSLSTLTRRHCEFRNV